MYTQISEFLGTFPSQFSWIVPITFILICLLAFYTLFVFPFLGGK